MQPDQPAGTAAHTPLPWERFGYIGHAGGLRHIRTQRGSGPLLECKEPLKTLIAECERDADARYIVLACNSHPALVEAAEAARQAIVDMWGETCGGKNGAIRNQLTAAIKAAKGG